MYIQSYKQLHNKYKKDTTRLMLIVQIVLNSKCIKRYLNLIFSVYPTNFYFFPGNLDNESVPETDLKILFVVQVLGSN